VCFLSCCHSFTHTDLLYLGVGHTRCQAKKAVYQPTRGHFEGERRSYYRKAATHGNSVPILIVYKNSLWTTLRTIFRPKCTTLQDFAYTISNFSQGLYPRLLQMHPWCLAWTRTPICARLASVPIIPVLRNDHCCVISISDITAGKWKDAIS